MILKSNNNTVIIIIIIIIIIVVVVVADEVKAIICGVMNLALQSQLCRPLLNSQRFAAVRSFIRG